MLLSISILLCVYKQNDFQFKTMVNKVHVLRVDIFVWTI